MHCLYGGYNLHRFSDAPGLVLLVFPHVANFRYVANFTFLTLTAVIID